MMGGILIFFMAFISCVELTNIYQISGYRTNKKATSKMRWLFQ
jgi:hypothetical protein